MFKKNNRYFSSLCWLFIIFVRAKNKLKMIASFIAQRIYKQQKGVNRISRPAIIIATWGVAIGLFVMLLSVFIVMGFKKQITENVVGFEAPLIIHNFDANQSYEMTPIHASDSLLSCLNKINKVERVQRFSTKPGIIKTEDHFQAIVLKGIAQEYNIEFLKNHLVEGDIPQFTDSKASKGVLISRRIAKDLKLNCGDNIYTYYINETVRARKFTVKGIYETNFLEFDKHFIISDLYTCNRLNKWKKNQVGGLEILITDFDGLSQVYDKVSLLVDGKEDVYGNSYYTQTIYDLQKQLFAWLGLLDTNVWVILILMVGITGLTIISGLFILILERTNMIGVLKALGATDWTVQRIFLQFAFYLIGKGLLYGNIIALAIYLVQTTFHIFPLDSSVYYVNTVPFVFDVWIWLLVNIATLVVSVAILIGPSFLITKIHPSKSIRFE